MYWQTNDIWQGASWAAVDYTGRYKMVQYFTERFYAPFLVSPFGTAVHGRFGTHVINDEVYSADHKRGELVFTMHTWADGPVGGWKVSYDAPPGTAGSAYNSSWDEMLVKGGCPDADGTNCFLTVDAYDGQAPDGRMGDADAGSSLLISSNYLLLSPFIDVTTMQNPQLQVGSVALLEGEAAVGAVDGEVAYEVIITAAASAAFVWIESKYAGRWSDNGLLMVAGAHALASPATSTETPLAVPKASVAATKTITFYSDLSKNGEISSTQLLKTLQRGWFGMSVEGGTWSLTDTSPEYMGKP
jgi:beta-mannosidase